MRAAELYSRGEIGLDEAIRRSAQERAAQRRANGVVYTPPHVAQLMVASAQIGLEDTVWEPSCGHGAFVFPILQRFRDLCGSWAEAKSRFVTQALCSDLDPLTIDDLRRLASTHLTRMGVDTAPEELSNIRAMNALDAGFGRRFSLTIGNPPYVRTRDMDATDLRDLRKRFPVMRKGNVDLYYAFIQRALDLSDRAVLIVPNACLSAAGAADLRSAYFPRLREIRDFGGDLPFEDARAYVAILTFAKGPQTQMTYAKGLDGAPVASSWRDLTGDAFRAAPKLAKSGIATLADSAYRVVARDGRFISPVTGGEVEPAMVRRLIKITRSDEAQHMIFPYADRRVLPERLLAEAYPEAYRHLLAVQEKLMARDKGKVDGYPSWFAYGRSQGLHEFGEACSLILVPTMIGGNAVPFRYEGPSPLFVSGYAVEARLDPEGTLLSPEFRRYVEENGRPKPGGYHSISVGLVNAWVARTGKGEISHED